MSEDLRMNQPVQAVENADGAKAIDMGDRLVIADQENGDAWIACDEAAEIRR